MPKTKQYLHIDLLFIAHRAAPREKMAAPDSRMNAQKNGAAIHLAVPWSVVSR